MLCVFIDGLKLAWWRITMLIQFISQHLAEVLAPPTFHLGLALPGFVTWPNPSSLSWQHQLSSFSCKNIMLHLKLCRIVSIMTKTLIGFHSGPHLETSRLSGCFPSSRASNMGSFSQTSWWKPIGILFGLSLKLNVECFCISQLFQC